MIINPRHLILMEKFQRILCFGLRLSGDHIRPAGVIVMSRRHLYITRCGFDMKTKSESDQYSLHCQRHEGRYRG